MKRSSSDGRKSVVVALTVSALLVGTSVAAHAQGVAPPPSAYPPPPAAYPPPPAAVPAPPSPVPEAPPPVAVAQPGDAPPPSDLDFDPGQRRFGIGYAGVSTIPTGASTVTAPALGLRYWLGPTSGLDLALGFSWAGGSTDAYGYSTDKSAVWGVIVQGGYPLVLAAHKHVCFEVIPYLTFAYGGTSMGTGAAEIDFSGLRLDVGARGGFEVFFGFIGIPELALSATVGAQFEYQRLSQSNSYASASDTTLTVGTTVQNNPWDFFTGNVSARYYF